MAPAGWAEVARKEAAPEPKVDISALLSSAGLQTAVVDANAIIGGGVKLAGVADQFFTVREVLDEVRDPASRFHLATLPVAIRCLEPTDEALAAVTKFSRATGDFHSLSGIDLKLLALTYTLEAQAHGAAHIRTRPPPLLVTPSSIVRPRDPPGWGIVHNPEEWEGIEDEPSVRANSKSRILGLKPLQSDDSKSDTSRVSSAVAASTESSEERASDAPERDVVDRIERMALSFQQEEDLLPAAEGLGRPNVDQEGNVTAKEDGSGRGLGLKMRKRSKIPKATQKPLPSLDGKLNVAEGVDASKGKVDEDGSGWQRASCRSTRRNYLKREARRSAKSQQAAEAVDAEPFDGVGEESKSENREQTDDEQSSGFELGSTTVPGSDARLLDTRACVGSNGESIAVKDVDHEDIRLLEFGEERNDSDGAMPGGDGEDASSCRTDGVESEDSWQVGPMWKSSIACITADYAMQNVLLQMGLRLLSTSGMHIRELNKWVLKCQACNHVTSDVGRMFCPKCGNGGTLFKVSVTVGPNGTLHAGQIRRINLRGTRYSLPMPKGGREGVAQNPVLREDQLPQKLLRPRIKKAKDSDTYSSADVIFSVAQETKTQKLAGVKSAAAIFGGRRNPNERRGACRH